MFGHQGVALLEGVALFEEVCHWGWVFMFQMLKLVPSVSPFLLPANPDVELSAPSPAPSLSAGPEDNGPNL